MRCGFWLLVHWFVCTWSSRSFSKERIARVSSRNITLTNKSNCLTYIVASSLVCTSPSAVITVVGLLDVLMVSNSAELRSFLLTICMFAPESTTNSLFLRLFHWRSREYPFFRGKVECSFAFFFELENVLIKIPSLASGTSLLSFTLFMGLVQFRSVGTSLMRNFDNYYSQRWFLFPDTRLT